MCKFRRLGNRLTPTISSVPDQKLNPVPFKHRFQTAEPVHLKRSQQKPYERHLLPDFEGDPEFDLEKKPGILDVIDDLPVPRIPTGGEACIPEWNSVALFFNLDMPASDRPGSYSATSSSDALAFLDEGNGALDPGISEFLCNYWNTLSYGNLAFGLDTPRDSSGQPLVPSITPPDGDNVQHWTEIIRRCITANAEAVWEAGGELMKDGKRWIPSVVLVQNYNTHASAHYGSITHSVDGETYLIGDRTHISYSLNTWSPPDAPAKVGRGWWGTLCHEYGHNFLEFGDLYGPQGCTGYWDLLGDNTPPGRMSEVCSAIKERLGWLSYKEVIEGPNVATRNLSLEPYTTTGEAYKIVPDPDNTPHEYFLLEYRKSTGNEVWRPDGGLPEEGLLITHINNRLGIPSTWLLREAPFFDPEFADDPDPNYVDWTGHKDLSGKLFNQHGQDTFTPATTPNSDLYGARNSGLHITNIRTDGDECHFSLRIDGNPQVGWTVSEKDRALAGRFTPDSSQTGEEIFIRNDDAAALLTHRQAQWLVSRHQNGWIGGWNLGGGDRELVADLDGDGRDEIYIRSNDWAGVLKWRYGRFRSLTVQHDWIDDWNLGEDNWEHMADLDGDGQAEIYIRSPEWAGVMKLIDEKLQLLRIHHDWIGGWNLGSDNSEFAGRFSRSDRDEIAIRSPNWLGLFQWDERINRLRLARIQHDWVDGWNLGGDDWHVVGDFDGDGRDEIFIRSGNWAGILKWSGGRFRIQWMTDDTIEHKDGDTDHAMELKSSDRTYSGRFRSGKDAVLHRDDEWGIGIIAWQDGAMKVVRRLKSRFNRRWNLGSGDHFVVGDFHRLGTDVADPMNNPVIDGLTDVFIHNAWGTGMVGINHGQWTPDPNDTLDQIGLTWIQPGKLIEES